MSQICHSRFSILPNKKKTIKICLRLVNFCQSDDILQHLVTLSSIPLFNVIVKRHFEWLPT